MLIVDAHQDLAWNMLTFGRDYTLSVKETRRREAGAQAPVVNGDTLLGWPEYQRGRVALVFATLFAAPANHKLYPIESQIYADPSQANRLYWAQLDLYHRLVDDHADKFRLIMTRPDLEDLLAEWKTVEEQNLPEPAAAQGAQELEQAESRGLGAPVGLVILMEGAEGVRAPGELEEWWQRGLRLIGPAWAGTRFCGGTNEPGPLTKEGYALLEAMAGFGFTLDLSHMDEQAALQALDIYPGRIVATHANAKNLLKGMESNRHLSDRLIAGILEREGVIGVVLYNRFLKAGWKKGDPRQAVSLQDICAQIDYICQMAGDARHVGIGSDFDGGLGLQSVPPEIDSIADVQKLAPLLSEKGYPAAEIAAVLGENWLNILRQALPDKR